MSDHISQTDACDQPKLLSIAASDYYVLALVAETPDISEIPKGHHDAIATAREFPRPPVRFAQIVESGS